MFPEPVVLPDSVELSEPVLSLEEETVLDELVLFEPFESLTIIASVVLLKKADLMKTIDTAVQIRIAATATINFVESSFLIMAPPFFSKNRSSTFL